MKPSISDAVSEGLSLTFKHFGRFVVPSLILFFSIALYMGVSFGAAIAMEIAPIVGLVLQMVSILLQTVVGLVSAAILIWLIVRAFQVIRSSDSPVFTWGRFGWYLLYQLLLAAAAFVISIPVFIVSFIGGVGIGALVGTGSFAGAIVFAVIAGLVGLVALLATIYVSVRLVLVPYAISDTGANPIEALKRSWQLSRGRFWPLVGLSILMGFINLIGFVALGFGLLFTIPASHVVISHYYDQLLEKA